MAERTWWEKVELKGNQVIERLQDLVAEGNVRRVRVKQKDRLIAEFPLTIGVVGAVFAPVLAAIGAITALLTDCSIEIERAAPAEPPSTSPDTTHEPPASPQA
jgi:Domain of unknown function (DUF4342)